MSNRSPYLTLAAAAGVFATLIAVNMANDDGAAASSPVATPTTSSVAPQSPPREAPSEPPAELTPPAFPRKAVYAGHTANDGPALAVAILGDRAAAYFCDGVSAESWLTGSAQDGQFSLTSVGSDRVHGRLHNGALVGSARVQGDRYHFRLRPVAAPAGLYRARSADGSTTIGWIVLPDGSQVGIERDETSERPAPILTPGDDVRIDTASVAPHPVLGDEEL